MGVLSAIIQHPCRADTHWRLRCGAMITDHSPSHAIIDLSDTRDATGDEVSLPSLSLGDMHQVDPDRMAVAFQH